MTANKIDRSSIALLALVLIVAACRSDEALAEADRRDVQVAACVSYMAREVGQPFASAPDFKTLHEATAWVAQHLPPDVRTRLAKAGAVVSAAVGKDAFSDGAALRTALFGSTLVQLQGLPDCTFDEPESAVPRETLLDQFAIGLRLDDKSVIGRLRTLGVDDDHYAKQVVFYGVVLDFSGIAWTEEQLAALVRRHPVGSQ